jgi:hypothetical protein
MIDAMKQALEIIKNMRSGYGDDYPTEKERKTITALRQAIEEAEKQEPVAWIQEDRIVPELGYDCTMTREHPKELGYTPLYTAPPRKEWVGLTDDESSDIYNAHHNTYGECITSAYDLVLDVEAKLKEKNCE